MAHVVCCARSLENNIRIDCIAGTSAGSIVGGAFAAGMPVDEIAEFGRKLALARHWTCDDVAAGCAE